MKNWTDHVSNKFDKMLNIAQIDNKTMENYLAFLGVALKINILF